MTRAGAPSGSTEPYAPGGSVCFLAHGSLYPALASPASAALPSCFWCREDEKTVHTDIDRRSYYLGRLERAAALPSDEQVGSRGRYLPNRDTPVNPIVHRLIDAGRAGGVHGWTAGQGTAPSNAHALVLLACLQGGDVKGCLRHQQLLDEAMHFYLNEFEVLIIDGQPQLSPQLDAWSAPYLAHIVAAQVGRCFAS